MIKLWLIDLDLYPDPTCNREIDIDAKTNFTLEASNPALWDYSGGITSTFSYSIKLPRTINNDSIFKAYEPNINKRLGVSPIRVWIDGVEVLNDAIISSIAWSIKDITITLSTEKFMALKNINVKLKDLDFKKEYGSYILNKEKRWWDKNSFAPLPMKHLFTEEFDGDDELEMGNPAVAIWYLNNKVRKVSGINFSSFLDDNHYMICKKPKERYDIDTNTIDSFKWKLDGKVAKFEPIQYGSNDSFNVCITSFTCLNDGKLNCNDLKIKFSGSKYYPVRLDVLFKLYANDDKGGKSMIAYKKYTNVLFTNNVSGEYVFEFIDFEFFRGFSYNFNIYVVGTPVGGGPNYPLDLISEKLATAFNSYSYPVFYLGDCLPDVTLIDYINSILIYNDEFLNFGADGGVVVESRADWLVPDNTEDWTDKIINIDSINVDVLGWNKEISFEYKDDDDKELDGIKDNDYKLAINYRVNKKETTTVFKSIFSAYLMGNRYVTHIDRKPTSSGNKLIRVLNDDGWCSKFVTPFQPYIESTKLAAIINNPLTVQATILFNALDFLSFNFKTKIFIQQLNSYFIVHRLRWTEMTAKVTLIKIQN